MPPISLLIKPSSSNCNLRCKYCFYYSLAGKRDVKSYGMMSLETLESLVKKALEYADVSCSFMFQGGEPTLAGLPFYKKLIEFEKKYNIKNVEINNAIQTNGMVINEDWAKFLAENHFLIGLSLDGPKEINDTYRVVINEKGSFQRVLKTVQLFDMYKVEYNVLSVVTAFSCDYAHKIYSFFKKNNFKFLQFIPCIDPFGEDLGSSEYSLTPKKYAKFLNDLFDRWYDDIIKGNIISIRYFDNLISMAMGFHPETCGMSGQCSCQNVIEADGSVFPCDFYAIDEWCLGNFKDYSFDELRNSETANRFIKSSEYIDPECKECKWFNLCYGSCRRYREPFENGKPVLNYFCPAYKEFFKHCGDRIYSLAEFFKSRYNIK